MTTPYLMFRTGDIVRPNVNPYAVCRKLIVLVIVEYA